MIDPWRKPDGSTTKMHLQMQNVYNEIKTQPKFHINIAFFLSLKTFNSTFSDLLLCSYKNNFSNYSKGNLWWKNNKKIKDIF